MKFGKMYNICAWLHKTCEVKQYHLDHYEVVWDLHEMYLESSSYLSYHHYKISNEVYDTSNS